MFFYSAQSNAHAQQRELEESSSFRVDESIESPLLLEQVGILLEHQDPFYVVYFLHSRASILQEMLLDPSKQARLGFICGVVAKSKAAAFERILFRATRGNVFLNQVAIEDPVLDPATGEKVCFFQLSFNTSFFFCVGNLVEAFHFFCKHALPHTFVFVSRGIREKRCLFVNDNPFRAPQVLRINTTVLSYSILSLTLQTKFASA